MCLCCILALIHFDDVNTFARASCSALFEFRFKIRYAIFNIVKLTLALVVCLLLWHFAWLLVQQGSNVESGVNPARRAGSLFHSLLLSFLVAVWFKANQCRNKGKR